MATLLGNRIFLEMPKQEECKQIEVKFQFAKEDGYGILFKYVGDDKITVVRRKLTPGGHWPCGALHVTFGGEEYLPTTEDFDKVASMFMQAWEDPKGAVVVTHSSVNVQFVPAPDGNLLIDTTKNLIKFSDL